MTGFAISSSLAPRAKAAALLVLLTSLALLIGALAFQYGGGLPPCEMCIWQRWPHGAAMLSGLAALLSAKSNPRLAMSLAWAAAFFVAVSGAIGIFHAGVEWHYWPGPTHCAGAGYVPGAEGFGGGLGIVRCDVAMWRLFGISLAGYNAILSLGAAFGAVMVLTRK